MSLPRGYFTLNLDYLHSTPQLSILAFSASFPQPIPRLPLSATLCINVFMTSWMSVGIQTSSVVLRPLIVASSQNLLPVQSKTGKMGLQGALWESQRTEG